MPSPNPSLILREVKGSKLTISEMDGDLLYLAQTLSSSDGTGIIQVTGSSFNASNTNITGSGLSLLNITNVVQANILSYNSSTGQVYYVNTASIMSPAPSDTYIQYNSGSKFGATGSFRFIYTSQSLQQGRSVTASGLFSHAEGYETHASRSYSHAEGELTTAKGIASHAEGNATFASGDYSHAEGELTNSKGYASHAEGYSTFAGGIYSHAESSQTSASGNWSHAEGLGTIAQGDYSHAEGSQTSASGNWSHAEGSGSIAFGTASHAEGNNTVASGSYQLVIGQYNVANASQSAFIVGDGTANNARHNVLFVSKSHFEVSASNTYLQGLIDTPQTSVLTYDSTTGKVFYTASSEFIVTPAPSDTYIQYNSGSKFGANSSFRFIYTSQSLQQGFQTVASGSYSHAEGYQTSASGNYSHAEGIQTKALGLYSHAEGYQTTASNQASHAEGINTIASGFSSHAEGSGTTALNDYSHAEGEDTKALGSVSHAEGFKTTASGDYSHVEGRQTTALGFYSHAEGRQTTTLGDYSHAEGSQTTTSGSYSHAEGYLTFTSGNYSHAEGEYAIAKGVSSHAEGYSTLAEGNWSHAAGNYTTASGDYQSVIGQYNVSSTSQSAFIIGDGESGSPHNVLFVSKSHFEVSASNTYLQGLSNNNQPNILVYNTSSGQLSYTNTVTSASYAATASYVPSIRAGSASIASFTSAGGGDYIATVDLNPDYPNNNYAITITGEDARSWTIQSKTAQQFTINSNSQVVLTGPVYWIAIPFNN